jgi:PST family polysaccharide transporter
MKSLLSFGANTFAVQVVNYVSSNLDSVLIGKTLGAVTLGLYSRAFQLVSLPLQQLASPLTRVVLPYLTRLTDAAAFAAAARKAQVVLAYGLIAILSILASTSEPLIHVVLGARWVGASTTLEILAAGGLFQCLGYVYYWIFLARARTGMLFWSELAGRAVMAGAMVLWVSRGPEWVAGAGAVGLFVIWLVGTTVTVPAIGVKTRPLVSAALRPVALFGSAYAVVKLARALNFPGAGTSSLLELLSLVLLWAAWVVLVCAIFPKLRADIAILISIVKVAVGRKSRPTRKAVAV